MKRKIRVGVIFGGKSGEHEVSLQSARSVIEAMDKDKYEPVLFAIDKKGKWHLSDSRRYLLDAGDPAAVRLSPDKKEMALVPGEEKERFLTLNKERPIGRVDVVFPVLHGPFGEDGTVQGLLKLAEVPFVGPGVLGSAVGMDKDVMKRLFREAGIPTPKFLVFRNRREADFKAVKRELGLPFFVIDFVMMYSLVKGIRDDLGERAEPVTRQWSRVRTAEELEAAEQRPAPEPVVVTRAVPDPDAEPGDGTDSPARGSTREDQPM